MDGGIGMSQIAPSILAADFNRLGGQIHELEENDVEILRRIHNIGTLPQIEKLRVPCRMFPTLNFATDFPDFHIRFRKESIHNRGLSHTGRSGKYCCLSRHWITGTGAGFWGAPISVNRIVR